MEWNCMYPPWVLALDLSLPVIKGKLVILELWEVSTNERLSWASGYKNYYVKCFIIRNHPSLMMLFDPLLQNDTCCELDFHLFGYVFLK